MSSLFGGDTPQVTPNLPHFNAGGLNVSFGGEGGVGVSASPERKGLVSDLSNIYKTLGGEYGALRDTVAPGYNSLLQSRLGQINDAAKRSVGNLRQNLAARRILGSSFGQDTISRLEAEFARQRDQATAENFIQSLNANQELLSKQYKAYADQFNTGLNELNFEAEIARGMATQGAQILNDTARINAEFEAKSQAGAGNFLGTVLGMGTKLALAPVTGGGSVFGSIFGGGMPPFVSGNAGGTGGILGGLY